MISLSFKKIEFNGGNFKLKMRAETTTISLILEFSIQ